MVSPNPILLAERQLARDERVTSRFRLFQRKMAKMSGSPLAYLRGSAPLFYELLTEEPELGAGPGGEGWICGDAHLENFGVYRVAEKGATRGAAVFDLNDFDETIVGPWRLDALRIVTSLILGSRELGADGARALDGSRRLLDAYAAAAFGARRLPPPPAPVVNLIAKVERRSQADLLDRRTEIRGGSRSFALGDRYARLSQELKRSAVDAFEAYARGLERSARIAPSSFEVLDVAFRVAGTGSLGKLRVAVLTRGKGGPDGAWIFDMKEQGAPSASALLGRPKTKPAARVVEGLAACIARPPRMVGAATLRGASMFVRRLMPQEDKLSLDRVSPEEIGPLAAYLGALLGRAHRRGATKVPRRAWSKKERSALIDRAVVIAGIHEAAYLAMCRERAPAPR